MFLTVLGLAVAASWMPDVGDDEPADREPVLLRVQPELGTRWKPALPRTDGARLWLREPAPGASSGSVIALRLFDDPTASSLGWLVAEAAALVERGCEMVQEPRRTLFGALEWSEMHYLLTREGEGDPVATAHCLSEFGAFKLEAVLFTTQAGFRRDYEVLQAALSGIAYGELGRMPAERFRPATTLDLVGRWDMVALESTGTVDPSNPWYAPEQGFVFQEKGGMRHLSSEEPIGDEELRRALEAPLTMAWSLPAEGQLRVVHAGGERAETFHVRLWPPEASAAAPERGRASARSAPVVRPGDLLVSQQSGPSRPLVVRILRRRP